MGWSWILIAALGVAGAFGGPMVVRRLRALPGPVVNGTAQVLSLRQFGSVEANGPARMLCRARLQVHGSDGAPYETTVWQIIAPWELGGMHAGATVPVQISAAKPTRVRIGAGLP